MKTSYIEALGFLAAILGTFSLVPQPQVIKTFKSKSVRDISLSMCLIVAADSILWLSYGVITFVTPNSTKFDNILAAFVMIILKLRLN